MKVMRRRKCDKNGRSSRSERYMQEKMVMVSMSLPERSSWKIRVLADPVPDDAKPGRKPGGWEGSTTSPHRTIGTDAAIRRQKQMEDMTYPFRKQSVAWAEATTVAETHATAWNARLVVHNDILLVVADEVLEPLHEFWVSADESTRAVDEDCAIEEILAEEVAELQELIEGVLVADDLLGAIEEAQFLTRRSRGGRRWERRGESGD